MTFPFPWEYSNLIKYFFWTNTSIIFTNFNTEFQKKKNRKVHLKHKLCIDSADNSLLQQYKTQTCYLGWCKTENYLLNSLLVTFSHNIYTAFECNFPIFIILIIQLWFLKKEMRPAQNQKIHKKKNLIIYFAHTLWHVKPLISCSIISLSSIIPNHHSQHNFSRSIILLCSRHRQFSCQNHYSSNWFSLFIAHYDAD